MAGLDDEAKVATFEVFEEMRITLIRPPKLMVVGAIGTGASVSSSPYPTAPLGIALIAAALRASGHSVSVIDGIAEGANQYNPVYFEVDSDSMPRAYSLMTQGLSVDEILHRIPENTDVIGISCMFTHNWLADRDLLFHLTDRFPKAFLMAGGESITGMGEESLRQCPGLRACVLGEGEETVVDLMSNLSSGANLSSVSGIIWRDSSGEIQRNPKRSRLKQLDAISLPAWDLLPIDNYERQGRFSGDVSRVSLPILATRGCPYTCTFCTSPDMWGTRYYMRTPEHVANEMEMMLKRYNVTNFEFYDLTAIIKKEWIIELSSILIERKLDIYWRIPSGTRSEAIDEEVAKQLIRSGCYTITYAPESGSPRLLQLIHKRVKLSSMIHSIKSSSKHGLVIYLNMIQALPDETHRDVWKTITFLVRAAFAGADELSLGTFRPYPGTVLHRRLMESGQITYDNDDYFLETLLTIETEESFYNENVSPKWYRFYNKLILITFYLFKFVARPSKLVRSIRNIHKGSADSRFDRTVLFYLRGRRN
jgi:anaerobic magnesium-protoporphyrin IX monomethyl ester cyclase